MDYVVAVKAKVSNIDMQLLKKQLSCIIEITEAT